MDTKGGKQASICWEEAVLGGELTHPVQALRVCDGGRILLMPPWEAGESTTACV